LSLLNPSALSRRFRANGTNCVVAVFLVVVPSCYGGCCQTSGTEPAAVEYDIGQYIKDVALYIEDQIPITEDDPPRLPGCCVKGAPGTCNWRRDCCNLGVAGYWRDDAEYDAGTHFCESYHWNEPTWGVCSSECGEGIQQRESAVQCIRDRDGAVAPASKCDPAQRPVDARACVGTTRCGYGFVGEEWGVCSVRCGDGVQRREISCVRSDGARVETAICQERGSLPPPSEQSCSTIVGCTYFFEPSPWTPCNTACVQFRTLTCTRSDDTLAEGYFCSSLPNLPTSQACC